MGLKNDEQKYGINKLLCNISDRLLTWSIHSYRYGLRHWNGNWLRYGHWTAYWNGHWTRNWTINLDYKYIYIIYKPTKSRSELLMF